ncbi:RNA polymerase Rpc34, partial [Paraphysoderma sedebokerense]
LRRVKSLDQDEKLVYDHIKASGNEGLWIKTLKAKTNLHQGVVQKCVKSLEQRGHIKSIKSVKYPTRKMYMLAELTPSVDITGGPWFTEQEFDVDFIEQIAKQCHRYIISQSIPRHDPSAIYPPNYSKYPTATKVHTFIKDAKISTVELSIEDITLVLDTLAYDGKVQKIRKDDYPSGGSDVWCYKAVRDSSVLNYWHEVPCGRCPVLSFCSESGPVNPRNCEYYKKWLYDF